MLLLFARCRVVCHLIRWRGYWHAWTADKLVSRRRDRETTKHRSMLCTENLPGRTCDFRQSVPPPASVIFHLPCIEVNFKLPPRCSGTLSFCVSRNPNLKISTRPSGGTCNFTRGHAKLCSQAKPGVVVGAGFGSFGASAEKISSSIYGPHRSSPVRKRELDSVELRREDVIEHESCWVLNNCMTSRTCSL